jgi:hypothetical protein
MRAFMMIKNYDCMQLHGATEEMQRVTVGCYRVEWRAGVVSLEHDPEKACPALHAGWIPVFGKRLVPAKAGIMLQEEVSAR